MTWLQPSNQNKEYKIKQFSQIVAFAFVVAGTASQDAWAQSGTRGGYSAPPAGLPACAELFTTRVCGT